MFNKGTLMVRICLTIVCFTVLVGGYFVFANKAGASDLSAIRVVCIGDSITEAGNISGTQAPSFRYELWKKFVDSNVDVQFLGRSTTSSAVTPDYKDKVYPAQHLEM